MNALTKIYGPTVGAPVVAQQAQNYLQSTRIDPLKVQYQGLANTSLATKNKFDIANNPTKLAQGRANLGTTQISNAFNTKNNPLRIQHQGLVNTNLRAKNKFNTSRNPQILAQGAMINQNTARKQKQDIAATQRGNGVRVAYSLGVSLSGALKKGMAPGDAWNAVVPEIQRLTGATPQDLAQMKTKFDANPTEFATLLTQTAAAVANGAPTGAQVASAPGNAVKDMINRAKLIALNNKIAIDKRLAPGIRAKAQADLLAAQNKNSTALKKAEVDAASAQVFTTRLKLAPDLLKRLAAVTRRISGNAPLNEALGKYVSGSDAKLFTKLAESMTATLGLTDVASSRQQGAFAGRVTNYELQAMGGAYAPVDLSMTPAEIMVSLRDIQRVIPHTLQYANGLIKATNDNLTRMRKAIGANPLYGSAAQPAAAQPAAAQPAAAQPTQTLADVVGLARQAIANGAPVQAVMDRMSQGGYDPQALYDGPQPQGGQ